MITNRGTAKASLNTALVHFIMGHNQEFIGVYLSTTKSRPRREACSRLQKTLDDPGFLLVFHTNSLEWIAINVFELVSGGIDIAGESL